ncbi:MULTISPECIES: hypothetical protein [unclassified Crossiella]|uniref:hypothetical protein n=1 Tax=unclassified Crossiella TaxID=2620835 RepID=UPI001FFEB7DA|nr:MULTISPECIES: hypothetical protein [unclassified Crossiella]MCK2240011.1 hypothetical protein [Crossiella sp. S99.2]MCK2252719.1 hypothetical protein [Crossiella sp. S99.1]
MPLIAPDEAAADSLTWFIAPGLTLRETHQSTELTTALPPNRFTPCFSLRGSQWRRLAQALLSADLWQEHLAGLARTVAATLRTQLSEQARADRGVLIRIFHRIDDNRAVEMFSYRDSTSHNVQEVLRQVHKHLTDVPEQSPGAPVAHPRTRGATDEQTLLVGDLVAVDGEFYRNELIEWRRVAPPAVIENAPPGATQP